MNENLVPVDAETLRDLTALALALVEKLSECEPIPYRITERGRELLREAGK